MADDALTEGQEAFAVNYVQTGNGALSYRRAYNKSENDRDEWIYVAASQLLDHPKVSLRIKELQAAAKERSEFTVMAALDELDEARNLAKDEKQPSAMISATNSKVKLLGMDSPKRVEVTGKDGESLNPENSAEDVARRVAFLLASAVEEQNNG